MRVGHRAWVGFLVASQNPKGPSMDRSTGGNSTRCAESAIPLLRGAGDRPHKAPNCLRCQVYPGGLGSASPHGGLFGGLEVVNPTPTAERDCSHGSEADRST